MRSLWVFGNSTCFAKQQLFGKTIEQWGPRTYFKNTHAWLPFKNSPDKNDYQVTGQLQFLHFNILNNLYERQRKYMSLFWFSIKLAVYMLGPITFQKSHSPYKFATQLITKNISSLHVFTYQRKLNSSEEI